ncbi:hypothetical protein GCM10022243_00910 [Saccharothrix violaceirubra]|uniref:TY-Chap N-terminal domain-containing protein n=1 Tax=Saccharothrix violaceirubra TaxID=413306 RepID=A0A7W7T2L1_9PSEU|nr:hypothetical protein [Saccharothrix violaceirubra]MBB4965413.1 hypothetical protein [Saccharothrix violaceirubra]
MSGWAEFGERFAETLREVTDRVFLVVFLQTDPKVYVQFAGEKHELHAQAAGPEVVPWADFGGMVEAGWAAPSGFDPPNWTFALPLPAADADYSAPAARCVVALRDAFALSGPDGLVYKAWRDGEWPLAGETWSPERIASRDVGENPLVLSRLGLPSVQG